LRGGKKFAASFIVRKKRGKWGGGGEKGVAFQIERESRVWGKKVASCTTEEKRDERMAGERKGGRFLRWK